MDSKNPQKQSLLELPMLLSSWTSRGNFFHLYWANNFYACSLSKNQYTLWKEDGTKLEEGSFSEEDRWLVAGTSLATLVVEEQAVIESVTEGLPEEAIEKCLLAYDGHCFRIRNTPLNEYSSPQSSELSLEVRNVDHIRGRNCDSKRRPVSH